MPLILARTPHFRTSARLMPPTSSCRRLSIYATAALLAIAAVVTVSTPARAAEAVEDGGFESSTGWNENPYWTTDGSNAVITDGFSRSGTWSVGLGNPHSFAPTPVVQQTVVIPDSVSTLSYWRIFVDQVVRPSPLIVRIDGSIVDTVHNDSADGWVRETVDVSGFADGADHILSYERVNDGPAVNEGGTWQLVYIDDVSIFYPTPRIPAKVELTYKPGTSSFRGTVEAVEGCAADRSVAIKRVKRGADRTIGRATTDPSGAFKVSKDAKPGRYYAVVRRTEGPKIVCIDAKSARVRVTA